jgi:putative ribosome biogenesis GTPase RsgA
VSRRGCSMPSGSSPSSLALKGKSDPVEAFRLLEVVAGAQSLARDFGTPLVGRERERQRLWRDYEDVIADRTCRLFTLLGPAGIGKSRLVADFLDRVGSSADVLRGRSSRTAMESPAGPSSRC